jgi:RNA polymerase sigma factor (sigma-70 family)
MENPVAFLFKVGQSKSRSRRTRLLVDRPRSEDHLVEPALEAALASLSERQRVVVLLVYGAQWTHGEVADLLGVRLSTMQKHAERGRDRLRHLLKVGKT